MEVYVDDETKLTLHGLQQHYEKVKESEKNKKLFELLDVLEFNQVIFKRCVTFDSRLRLQIGILTGGHLREIDPTLYRLVSITERS